MGNARWRGVPLKAVLDKAGVQAGSRQVTFQRYGLQRSIIQYTLFRNLRGFINDIEKQPGRSFDSEELEMELRCVWPHMVPVKATPPLEDDHVRRPALAASFTDPWTGAAVEVVGISGSGKTRLAAEILERSRLVHRQTPDEAYFDPTPCIAVG